MFSIPFSILCLKNALMYSIVKTFKVLSTIKLGLGGVKNMDNRVY